MRLGPRRALALIPVLLAAPAWAADYLGSHVWAPEVEAPGGYSALWLGPEGEAMVVLSDRGTWIRGVLERDGNGVVSDVRIEAQGMLQRSTGGPVRSGESDSESIAFAGGAFHVGFEGMARVMRYPTIDGVPEWIAQYESFSQFKRNRGIEALAADAQDRLYVIPEWRPGPRWPIPVYRFAEGRWSTAFNIEVRDDYMVTGADVGPDGRLYVLERQVTFRGFRSRVRSFAQDGVGERTELESEPGEHGNLESIATWRDAEGRLRATMVADDNQRPWLQVTEFVDYVLD